MILKAKFRFNRPIDTSKDFISTKDAFTVTIFGKEYSFDFLNYYGNVKKKILRFWNMREQIWIQMLFRIPRSLSGMQSISTL